MRFTAICLLVLLSFASSQEVASPIRQEEEVVIRQEEEVDNPFETEAFDTEASDITESDPANPGGESSTQEVETADKENNLSETEAFDIAEFDPANPGGEQIQALSFAFGFVSGVYGPYVQRAYDYDCFSEFYSVGSGLVDLSLVFQAMKYDLLGLVSWVLRGMLVGFGLLRTSFVCYGEYMYGLGNPYRELFGGIQLGTQLEANMNTYTPIDDVLTLFDVKGNEWDTQFDILFLISIACDAVSAIYASYAHGLMSYHFAHNAGAGISKVFFFLDKVLKLQILAPKKPWVTVA